MKTLYMIIIIIFLGLSAVAQTPEWNLHATMPEQQITRSYPLEVTTSKTSSLIFPAIIKSVDKGSREILVQKAKDVSNVLQVKGLKDSFSETNLTVITADGLLYHFTVRYGTDPRVLTFDMAALANENAKNGNGAPETSRLIFLSGLGESQIEEYCQSVTSSPRRIYFNKNGKNKVSFALLGIYIKGDVIFYRVRIGNRSNIDYDIDLLKFYIRDNARIKRTASQEVEPRVLYRYGDAAKVGGKSETELVFALEKFTIPDSKHLAIELFEKNGGRHCSLRVKNRSIVRAKVL
jgi:conjugative transposon TraN protein